MYAVVLYDEFGRLYAFSESDAIERVKMPGWGYATVVAPLPDNKRQPFVQRKSVR
jgi:hypothetical protein